MSIEHYDPLELHTLAEVSELTKRSVRSLYEDIAAGKLRVVKLGRSTRVPRSEVERYITESSVTLATVHKIDRKGQS